MGLLRMGKETDKSPARVLGDAIAFFGKGGTGLELARKDEMEVYFTGGGGHVTVAVDQQENGKTAVDVQTRDWEYDVERFLRKI